MAPDCGPVSVFNTTFRDCRSKGHPNCDEHDITYTGPTDPPLYYNGTVFDADEHHDFSRFDNDVHVYFELCTFRNMRYDCEDSSDGGGAIFSSPINCTMTIKKCMFHNCSCYGVEDDWDIEGFGGAIYVSGGYSSSGTFSLLDSTIDQCIVDYASGAVQVQSLPKVVLCGNIISRCNSPVGNGPASFVDVDDTIVHNCTFLNNEGALTGALAMFNDACGQTLVSNVHFRNSTCMRDSPLSKLRSDCFIYLCMAENTYVDCTTTSKRPNVYARDEEYDEDWYEPEDDNSTFEYSKLFLPILDSLSCSIEPTSQSLIQFAFAGKFVSDEQRYTMIVNDTNTHSQRELELVMRDGKLTTPDTHALRYNTLYTIIDFAKSSLSAELPLSLYAWDPASTIDTLVPFSFHTPQGPTLETIGGPVFDERGYVLSIPLHTIHVPLGEYVVHVLTPSGDTVELPAKFESKEESKIQIKIFSPDEDVDLSLALDANYTIVKIVKGTTQVQIDAPNLLLPPEPARIVSMAEASSTKNTISLNFTSKQIAFGVEYRMVLQEENGTEASNRIIPVTFSEASAIVEVDIINSSASATTRNSLSNSASLYDGRTYTLVSVFDSEGKKVYLEDCDVVKIDMVARAKAKQLTTTITVLSIVLGILGVLFLFLLIFLIIICWRKKKEEKKDEGEEETEESVGFTEETAGQTEEAELPAGKVSAEMEMTLTETEWTKSLETRPQPMDVMKEEPNEQADLSDETDRPHASEPLNSLPDSTIKEDVPVEETLAEKQLEEEPANVDENVERPKRKKKKKQAEQLEAEEETPETAPLLDAEEVAEEPAKKKKKKKKKKLMEELADEEEQSP
ncbi:hypothetical protein BLNAU_4069 [Blattamonas nauphoetae]|uniref:Right handed beta helix domain-containing protein n=1 Tax=Blattamonas nauphoetae TaxID=2049346 RepID=A0ABQ9YB73_9EUKA|nr:hypothetical protein BLNAU_4069 [Blattamonas nauphoetae]